MSIVDSRLTMLAAIKRSAGAADGYGGPGQAQPQDWQVINPAASCFVYERTVRQVATSGKVVEVEEIIGLFLDSEDVVAGDRIDDIENDNGDDLFPGVLYVNTVSNKVARGVVQFQEAILKRTR